MFIKHKKLINKFCFPRPLFKIFSRERKEISVQKKSCTLFSQKPNRNSLDLINEQPPKALQIKRNSSFFKLEENIDMSDLLLSWLNDEVQLSKKITNFESDFANGYLFGELLSKYNQQLNFSQF